MSRYKCIIFDCDGVLVDSEPISNQVMVDLANSIGANIDLDFAYANFKGNSFQNCSQIISKLINKKLPKNFEALYREQFFEKFKLQLKPIEGITSLIKSLKIPFCVASSGPEHKIEFNLKLTGLWPYFEGKVFSCYTIQKWKPDPAIFIWAAHTMGYDIKDCVVIEDSVIGVKAAIAGGFEAYGFTGNDHSNQLQNYATKTFDKMSQLKELL